MCSLSILSLSMHPVYVTKILLFKVQAIKLRWAVCTHMSISCSWIFGLPTSFSREHWHLWGLILSQHIQDFSYQGPNPQRRHHSTHDCLLYCFVYNQGLLSANNNRERCWNVEGSRQICGNMEPISGNMAGPLLISIFMQKANTNICRKNTQN